MTQRSINNNNQEFHKLSIQVSLNGLSFCVWDTIANNMLISENIVFQKELTPYGLQKELKAICEKHEIAKKEFSDIIVIHRNNLFSLVPQSLFDENELANYLKFNAKILANDHLAYDELENFAMVNVYVPFVNINNYIFELFGAFVYKHSGTVMVESLMNTNNSKGTSCFAHVTETQMELTVISNKKLVLYNSFDYVTKEDFMYYLLFTMEQLEMDTEQVTLQLFGAIEEGDDLYNLCYQYIKDVSIFSPSSGSTIDFELDEIELETIDFTVLSSL